MNLLPLVVSAFGSLPFVVTSTTLWMTIFSMEMIKFPKTYRIQNINTHAHTLLLWVADCVHMS